MIASAPELFTDVEKLATMAKLIGLPTICEWESMADRGCLIGFGPNLSELQLRIADYVARIFRGSAPGELPIEQPQHFDFVVNLATAAALGLQVPPSILARADKLID